MTSANGNRCLVVVQLTGGNDALNTVIPHNNELYYDFRPNVRIEQEDVTPLEDGLGLHPNMRPFKRLWDDGKLAIINGIGYPSPNRSHFRSMDVWHTAQPEKTVEVSGWLGHAIQEMDPKGENVLTGVNFGRGLPRALARKGVPVASVGNLETYGVLPDIQDDTARVRALEAFARMYGVGEGKDAVAHFFSQTGTDALEGADTLRTATQKYSSNVEYASNPIAQSLRNVAEVMFAGLGTRVFYTQHGGFDTHAAELMTHAKLWQEVSNAVSDFTDDLKEHGKEEDTTILLFSEFGRRIRDNGTGTDHGSGGVAFVVGGAVKGGLYGEYPSLREEDQLEGDLHFNNDFRSTYSTLLDDWLGLDATPIVHGQFEKFDFIRS